MKIFENYTVKRVSECSEISEIISCVPDVESNLRKRVQVEEYALKLSKYADNFCLYDKDERIAFVSAYVNDEVGKCAYISLIFAFPNFRGKGYGSVIYRFISEYAVAKGMKYLKLEVDKENESAIGFYKKNGMQITEENPDSYYMMKEF